MVVVENLLVYNLIHTVGVVKHVRDHRRHVPVSVSVTKSGRLVTPFWSGRQW